LMSSIPAGTCASVSSRGIAGTLSSTRAPLFVLTGRPVNPASPIRRTLTSHDRGPPRSRRHQHRALGLAVPSTSAALRERQQSGRDARSANASLVARRALVARSGTDRRFADAIGNRLDHRHVDAGPVGSPGRGASYSLSTHGGADQANQTTSRLSPARSDRPGSPALARARETAVVDRRSPGVRLPSRT
jgi:hypothetical protein